MEESKFIKTLFVITLALVFFAAVIILCLSVSKPFLPRPIISLPFPTDKGLGVVKFTSEGDFKAYIESVSELLTYGGFGLGGMRAIPPQPLALEEADLKLGVEVGPSGEPERVSATTVQVADIDEPDILKTDGQQIYFSQTQPHYVRPTPLPLMEMGEEKILPPPYRSETRIVKAFPPADLSKISSIDKIGNLLLDKNLLIIFSNDKIYGYDVSNPNLPQEKWNLKLENNNYLVQGRLFGGKIYLVLSQRINYSQPCPIEPLSREGEKITIACDEIYHPLTPIPADVTYTAMIINPSTAEIENNISFIGSSGLSVVYMSKNALYVTYYLPVDMAKLLYQFFEEKFQDLISPSVIERLKKLSQYDISSQAKLMEFGIIMEEFYNSVGSDERLRVKNEFNNRSKDYFQQHKREFEKTGIVKIELRGFKISATGEVPGSPLNQFSLDEYQNYLRIATTIEGRLFSVSTESVSDVTILDKNLRVVGLVEDLGKGEKIYSVRFIEDKGYVVTFRQIDPFYVLDLTNPQTPVLKGELKIPGYSSYLHPITKDKILGIGKEGSEVKISLFDVSTPDNPMEADKYTLAEYWSDVLNTHHAFLLDTKYKVFFLPGSRGGYIFSYVDDQLKLEKAVSDIFAKRAIYINDYMYIVGEDKIIVINEVDWEKINELEL